MADIVRGSKLFEVIVSGIQTDTPPRKYISSALNVSSPDDVDKARYILGRWLTRFIIGWQDRASILIILETSDLRSAEAVFRLFYSSDGNENKDKQKAG